MSRYLQIKVHSLTCETITGNSKCMLEPASENIPASIDISSIVIDNGEGVVAQSPVIFLGNQDQFRKQPYFTNPVVICEIPVREDDIYPRHLGVSLCMAEKDNNNGFQEFMTKLAIETALELEKSVHQNHYPDDNTGEKIISTMITEFSQLMGLGDTPVRPVSIHHCVNSYSEEVNKQTHQLVFHESGFDHKRRFSLQYSLTMSDFSAMVTQNEIYSNIGIRPGLPSPRRAGYPSSHRTFRFRKPAKTHRPDVPVEMISSSILKYIKLNRSNALFSGMPFKVLEQPAG